MQNLHNAKSTFDNLGDKPNRAGLIVEATTGDRAFVLPTRRAVQTMMNTGNFGRTVKEVVGASFFSDQLDAMQGEFEDSTNNCYDLDCESNSRNKSRPDGTRQRKRKISDIGKRTHRKLKRAA